MNFSQEQLAVRNSNADRIIALCGPGSGKSTVLVARIKRLFAEGADPRQFIVLSYTQAASRVLQERLGDIRLGVNSTLHAFMLRLLSEHHALVGLPGTLSVADDDATEGLLEGIMSEMGVSGVSTKKVLPLLKMAAYIEPAKSMSRSKVELIAIEFHQQLRAGGLLTFDTILYWGQRVIERMTEWPWTHLWLDEAQDSSEADWAIYRAMPCPTVFIVGDPDQRLYTFRGASAEFEKMAMESKPE